MTETRELLADCADLFITCDDLVKIPCCRFHVSTKCAVLKWVVEDTSSTDIPIRNVPSKPLRLALDVVHGLARLADYSLADVDLCQQGFDILGCDIDTAARVWELATVGVMTIEHLRPRLPRLMRAMDKHTVLTHAVKLAPAFEDVLVTVRACEPDTAMAIVITGTLCKAYPVGALIEELIDCVPNITLENAIAIVGTDTVGIYIHPAEVARITDLLRETFRHENTPLWKFIRSIALAMQIFDIAPLSCANMNGTVIMFQDTPHTSIMLHLDGSPPRRQLMLAKWIKFSLLGRAQASVFANKIDAIARNAKFLDVRMFVETHGQRAELWHSWHSPAWTPAVEARTNTCRRITGSQALFDAVVDAGKFSRKMSIRIDIFYGNSSVVENPLL